MNRCVDSTVLHVSRDLLAFRPARAHDHSPNAPALAQACHEKESFVSHCLSVCLCSNLEPRVCVCSENQLCEVCVWVDFLSIPQENETCSCWASSLCTCSHQCAGAFIIIAPTTTHVDSHAVADYASYCSRGWCRLEQFARLSTERVHRDVPVQGRKVCRPWRRTTSARPWPCSAEISPAVSVVTRTAVLCVTSTGLQTRCPVSTHSLGAVMTRTAVPFFERCRLVAPRCSPKIFFHDLIDMADALFAHRPLVRGRTSMVQRVSAKVRGV